MHYDFYLFACLLKEYDTEFANLEYDRQYERSKQEFARFQELGFDDENAPLYDCIVKYLSFMYKKQPQTAYNNMITQEQQRIINSITTEFEKINKTDLKLSDLAKRIKRETEDFSQKQKEFKIKTEAYEMVNQVLFDDFCKQVQDLCNELGLVFKYDNGAKLGLFTETREIKIIFPQFGGLQISWYVRPQRLTSYGLTGLDKSNLYLQKANETSYFYQWNELPEAIEVIAKEIIETHKKYSKSTI